MLVLVTNSATGLYSLMFLYRGMQYNVTDDKKTDLLASDFKNQYPTRFFQFFNTIKLQNLQDRHLISKISTRPSRTLKMTPETPETPENPIEITDHIKSRLCLENYKENYPHWEREIFDVLRGHGLLEFFYGTNLPSLPAEGTTSVEFERWRRKDKVIWNWLFSTLPPDTQSNLGQMAHATTHLLWKSLRCMYSTDPLPSEFNLEDPPFIEKTSTRSSKTPENPTNPQTSSTSENPIQINHQISIPLNEENYQQNFPHWKSEVLRVLGGLGLQDYLDRTMSHGVRWKHDKLIRNWLWSSLPPTIVSELRYQPCVTTEDLWECLHSMYTTYYFPKVRKLKLQLQKIKKGNATCAEYLQQINFIIDQLINAGCFLDEQQWVAYILQGLGQEFEPFVTSVTETSQTLTMTDLLGRLFDEEKRLKRLFSHPGQYSSLFAGRAQNAPLSQPRIVHNPGQNSSLFAGRAQYTPLSQSPIVHHPGQYSSLFAGQVQNAPLSQPRIVHNPGQNSSLFAGRAQYTPLSQPRIVHHPGQYSSLFAGRVPNAPLSQPQIVHNPGQNSSLFVGQAQYAPVSQPPIVHHPGQYSSLFAGRAQYAPLSQPPIVHNRGQYSSLFAGRAQYAPLSQPPIVHNPGQNSSLFAGQAQPVTKAYAAPNQPPTLNMDNFFSFLHSIGTDQAHVENGAGLGAEDSDLARWLPQDTSLIPLQTRDPAVGSQVVIISDDEEDAD